MKKRMLKGLVLGLLSSLICVTMALAATPRGEALTSINVLSRLLPAGVTEDNSRLQFGPKGLALSDSVVSISNEGDGIIGIVASSAFHQSVEWGMLTVFLDVLTEAGNWKCVDIYEYEFTKEEEADGELTSMTVALLIDNQPAGHYYRLRGIHEVEFINDRGKLHWEGQATRTDGIKITK